MNPGQCLEVVLEDDWMRAACSIARRSVSLTVPQSSGHRESSPRQRLTLVYKAGWRWAHWPEADQEKHLRGHSALPLCVLQTNLEHDVYERLTNLQEGIIPKKKAATDDDLHRINELIQVCTSPCLLLVHVRGSQWGRPPISLPHPLAPLEKTCAVLKHHQEVLDHCFYVKASKCPQSRAMALRATNWW